MFVSYKILIVKEERDFSQVCQAYDQNVTKLDKMIVGDMLDNFCLVVHGKIDQWESILGINAALNSENASAWWHSHVIVNTCPSKCIWFRD